MQSTLRGLDAGDVADVRDILIASVDVDGAFGAACYHLDPDGEASRDEVAARITAAFGLISNSAADRIEAGADGWPILAAIIRDEL